MTRFFELGVQDGKASSIRREEIALHPVCARDRFFAVGVKIEHPVMFEEAADDGADTDIFGQAFDLGRRAQTPRTRRSISTPAWEASYKAWMVSAPAANSSWR